MAETSGKTISELMGLTPHPRNISNNELSWWIARGSFKPLAPVREQAYFNNLMQVCNVGGMTGKPIFPQREIVIDWFKEDKEREWAEAAEFVKIEQKKMDLKNGKRS